MKTNLEALKAVYVKNGGSLTDTYEDIAGGAPVSAYKTLKDAIAALSKLTLGGGSGSYTETTTFFSGNATAVDTYGGIPEFQLEGVEELDSSVKTVTVVRSNATESNTYTLNYSEIDSIWVSEDAELQDGDYWSIRFFDLTESDVGKVYNITLSAESVEPNFKAAVKETIDKEYIDGDEHIGTTSFSDMLGTTILRAVNAADPSTGEFNVAFDFDNDIPILNSICWQAYNGVRHIKGNLSASTGIFDFNASYDAIIKSILIHPKDPAASPPENPFPQTEIFFDVDLYSFIAIIHGTVVVMGARGQNGGVHGARIYGQVYSMTD